jgi:aspartyl/glutamyl-tRNA(Asn/Gln) amidotransferase C subunit
MNNFEKLTTLAKLNFSDEASKTKAENQVTQILDMMAELSNAPTEQALNPSTSFTNKASTFRQDTLQNQMREGVVKNAPNVTEEGLFLTPQVLEG